MLMYNIGHVDFCCKHYYFKKRYEFIQYLLYLIYAVPMFLQMFHILSVSLLQTVFIV